MSTQPRRSGVALLVATVLSASVSFAAATPQQKCQAGKNQEAGKYLACRMKAEAKLVSSGDLDRYNDAIGKCVDKLQEKWAKLELKATEASVDCPTEGDLAGMDAYLAGLTSTVAAATTSGGGVPTCGDADLNSAGEQCDGADLGGSTCLSLGFASGTLGCTGGCQFDTSACNLGGSCGDTAVNNPGEECDGADLNGRSCADLGFFNGTLACNGSCAFDTSGCNLGGTCGDADVNATGEECDGADLNGRSCASLGFFSGTLACDGACDFDTSACDPDGTCGDGDLNATGEQCDGSDLGGASCTSLGYVSGSLTCNLGCGFDTSGCNPDGACGNGAVDADGEECDGGDLNGRSCSSLGFASGTLTCNGACDFDTSACDPDGVCGDGAANAVGEECDDGDLNGRSCTNLGFGAGTLDCDASCNFDTSGCPPLPDDCGNGTIQSPEECDQNNLNGSTCASEGFLGGDLSCSTACVLDTSACYNARFEDNADGTITDHVLGLMWEKKIKGNGIADLTNRQDADNTYRWAGQCTVTTAKRCQPTTAAESLCLAGIEGDTAGCFTCDTGAGEGTCNQTTTAWTWIGDMNNVSFAGHNDWRLPTPSELQSLIDYVDTTAPYARTAFHAPGCNVTCTDLADPNCSCTRNNDYASKTTIVSNTLNVWVVQFDVGGVAAVGKNTAIAARAVRNLP